MRQVIIVLSLTGSFMVLATVINLFDTLIMFLLFGILPDRTTPLSANQMLMIYGSATLVVAVYASRGAVISFQRALQARRTA